MKYFSEHNASTFAANITHPTGDHNDSSNPVQEEQHHDTSKNTTSTDISHNKLNASEVETQGGKNSSEPDADIKMSVNTTNDNSSASGSEKVSNEESGKNVRRRLLEDKDSKGNEDVRAATVENDGGLEAEADSSFELFRDTDELADEYNYDYDDYVDENMWGDEEWTEAQHEKLEDYVHIDAHVLCTPVSIVNSVEWSFFLIGLLY